MAAVGGPESTHTSLRRRAGPRAPVGPAAASLRARSRHAGRRAEGDRKPDHRWEASALERVRPPAQRVDETGARVRRAGIGSPAAQLRGHRTLAPRRLPRRAFARRVSPGRARSAHRPGPRRHRHAAVRASGDAARAADRSRTSRRPPSVTIKPTERRPHEGVSARRASDSLGPRRLPARRRCRRSFTTFRRNASAAAVAGRRSAARSSLVLPQRQSRETIGPPTREGVEKYFRIRAAAEVRDTDVYVLAAPSGSISATRTSPDEPGSFGWVDVQTPTSAPDNFIGFSDPPWRRDGDRGADGGRAQQPGGRVPQESAGGWKRGTASIRAMSATSTVARTARDARATVDRPVVDETTSRRHVRSSIRTQAESGEQFLHALCDHLRLAVLSPTARTTLADVVAHYNQVRKLGLTPEQQRDLVEYLKSL